MAWSTNSPGDAMTPPGPRREAVDVMMHTQADRQAKRQPAPLPHPAPLGLTEAEIRQIVSEILG